MSKWLSFLEIFARTFSFFKMFAPKAGKNSASGPNNDKEKDYVILDNIEKAKRGRRFENEVKNLLAVLKSRGIVDNYRSQPVYEGCFRPDFEVHVGDTIVVIDVTTTVRTDREKGKLWDAYWAKQILRKRYPEKRIEAITVVQKVEGRERTNFEAARSYIEKCSKPYDAVDHIMSLEDFVRYLYRLKGLEPPI